MSTLIESDGAEDDKSDDDIVGIDGDFGVIEADGNVDFDDEGVDGDFVGIDEAEDGDIDEINNEDEMHSDRFTSGVDDDVDGTGDRWDHGAVILALPRQPKPVATEESAIELDPMITP